MPTAPGMPADAGELAARVVRLQALVDATDAEIAASDTVGTAMRGERETERERRRQLDLQIVERDRACLSTDTRNSP